MAAADDRHPAVALLLFNNTGVGGAERRFAQVYEGLRRRKVAVALLINESLARALARAGVLKEDAPPALVVPEPAGRLAFVLRKFDYVIGSLIVGWWLMRHRPQLIHLVLGGVYLALPLQLVRGAPPSIVSVVGPSVQAIVGSRWAVGLYRLGLRLARRVDALTDSIRAMVEREGVASERIRVPGGSCVDTVRFQPAAARRPWVVFAGRLIPDKDPLLFVQACALVRERLKGREPALRFFMLGDGPLRADVETLIRQQGLAECTQVGWSERVETVLGQAAVFVSLQRTDNYPSQALLEAMACGAAVVATDVGLTRKLVDETVGLLVAAEPAAVADAVARLLENPDQAAAMGRRGRERVVLHHSMESYLDYIEGIYRSLRAE